MELDNFIRHIPGFPKEGILFHDIMPMLQDAEALRYAVDRLKLVLEPSGAATLAWLLAQREGAVAGPVVAVLSGGNVEWEGLQTLLAGKA